MVNLVDESVYGCCAISHWLGSCQQKWHFWWDHFLCRKWL